MFQTLTMNVHSYSWLPPLVHWAFKTQSAIGKTEKTKERESIVPHLYLRPRGSNDSRTELAWSCTAAC